jgi:hypothetical protein
MEELDEKGFVFLDDARRPFKCAMWGGDPWLFYWHADKKWVSLRKVTQAEVWGFPDNLSQEHQDLYDGKAIL